MNKEKDMEEKKPRIGHLCKFWDGNTEPMDRKDYVIDYFDGCIGNAYTGKTYAGTFRYCRELTPDDLVLGKLKLQRPEIGTPVCAWGNNYKQYIIKAFGCDPVDGFEADYSIIKQYSYAKPIPSLNSMLVSDLITHPDFQEYEV